MNLHKYIATRISLSSRESVSRAARWLKPMVTSVLLVAANASADPSAADFFIARVMMPPQLHSTSRSVANEAEHGSASEQFVETVLKGHAVFHGPGLSGTDAATDNRSWNGPDLDFMYGSRAGH